MTNTLKRVRDTVVNVIIAIVVAYAFIVAFALLVRQMYGFEITIMIGILIGIAVFVHLQRREKEKPR